MSFLYGSSFFGHVDKLVSRKRPKDHQYNTKFPIWESVFVFGLWANGMSHHRLSNFLIIRIYLFDFSRMRATRSRIGRIFIEKRKRKCLP
jgi:hypothetical protein